MSQQELIAFWQKSLGKTSAPKNKRKSRYKPRECVGCGEVAQIVANDRCRKCYDIRKNKAKRVYHG